MKGFVCLRRLRQRRNSGSVIMGRLVLVGILVLFVWPAWAQVLPDPRLTPGAIDPSVREENIGETICRPGYTHRIRPPEDVSYRFKRELMAAYGHRGERLRDYELDHLIPLELGGAPLAWANLWVEPRRAANGWDAARKDELERALNDLVCTHRLPLAVAQHDIARNWIAAYRRYLGPGH